MKKTIKVEGMKCEHCAAKLEQMLNTVEGVTARVDFPTCTATLEADHDILEDWELPTEIKVGEDKLALISKLQDLCPKMELAQTDPLVYDNNPTIVQNILKNKQRELYARVESRGIIYQLLAGFLQSAHPKQYIQDKRIRDVLAYIRSHLSEKPDLDKLAEVSCLSKDHLIRIFKKPEFWIICHCLKL